MNYVTMLGSRVPPSDHNVLQFTDGLLFNTYIFFLKLTNFVKRFDSDCNQQVADLFSGKYTLWQVYRYYIQIIINST